MNLALVAAACLLPQIVKNDAASVRDNAGFVLCRSEREAHAVSQPN